jgi:ABC-2 type transport system ATP-binding protein
VNVIEARGARRSYADVEALRGIDLAVEQGEIVALLGPNGAGKTTLVEILAGLRERSGGQVSVLGRDPARADGAWRERVGIVLQESVPDPGLTVAECLRLYAGYHRAPLPVAETATLVGLDGRLDDLADTLSGGQRRRLDLALALIGDPELLFLDEPTTGFDPAARRAAWEMVEGLRRHGRTIVLTTHAMDEAERLADRIVVIVDGRVAASGTPATIGRRDRPGAEIRFTLPAGIAADELPLPADAAPGRPVALRSSSVLRDLRTLADWALARNVDLPDLEVRRPALEDVYLALASAGGPHPEDSPCSITEPSASC